MAALKTPFQLAPKRYMAPTGLAAQPHWLGVTRKFLETEQDVSLFYFEIHNFFAFQSLFGAQLAERFLAIAGGELHNVARELFQAEHHIERLDSGQFLLLCPSPGSQEETSDTALRIRLRLKNNLKPQAIKLTGQDCDIHAGHARITQYGDLGPEAALYNALCNAQRTARSPLDGEKPGMLNEFRRILETPLIHSVYQPIVDLASGSVFAWEALARGPEDSLFSSPAALFDYAEDVGEIFSLERVCRESAITRFGGFTPEQKLFLNIHPRTLVDPKFSSGKTLELIREHGLKPENIVFEITERHAISDFTTFHQTLDHYRGQGYLIAVDDVGTGYSGLWSIAELRPEYIKVDMSLTRGIDANPVKRALLETFLSFSEKIGCKIIAEGIETSTELSSLTSMGVHYGQGFYLAKPAYPKPPLALKRPSRSTRAKRLNNEFKCSIPIHDLAQAAYPVSPRTPVHAAKSILHGDDPISALVVAQDNKPLGLIMSHHLDRALSSQYGISLYYNRSVTRIMDPSPLIVDGDTPVETVAQRATNRDRAKIYDHIITTRNNKLSGIVSVQTMLDTLAAVQVEMAKGVNPLTGLPGNLAIEREIEARSKIGAPFTIIYADLDNFKVYNDVYGFKNGDNILTLLAKILTWAAKKHNPASHFVGHIGGDDYVLVTTPQSAEKTSLSIIRCFQRIIKLHYTPQDRYQGYITGTDRNGDHRDFPIVSVSLAIVDCPTPLTLAQIAERSAQMKKYAKSIPGNTFVRNRRR